MCIFCTPWTQYMHGYMNGITSQIYINKWYQTGPFDFFQQTLLDECWLGSKPYKHMIFQMLLDNGPSANLSIVKVLVNGFIASYMGWSKFKRTCWVGRNHNVESNHTLVIYFSFDQARWQVMNSCASARAWMMAIEYVGWVVDGWTADSSRTLTINGT